VSSFARKKEYDKIYAGKGQVAEGKYNDNQHAKKYYERGIGCEIKVVVHSSKKTICVYNLWIGGNRYKGAY
jgi:hypothetical protein